MTARTDFCGKSHDPYRRKTVNRIQTWIYEHYRKGPGMNKCCKIFLPALLATAVLYAEEPVEITNSIHTVRFGKNGIVIQDARKKPLTTLQKVRLVWSPQEATPETAEKIDGSTIRINYRIDRDPTGQVSLQSTVRLTENGIRINYDLHAPEGVKTGGAMQQFRQPGSARKLDAVYKSGIWTRGANNGVPFEIRDAYFKQIKGAESSLWITLPGNSAWCTPYTEHLKFNKKNNVPDSYSAHFIFTGTPGTKEGFEAAAIAGKRPLAIRLTSGKPFNIWESGTPVLKLDLSNTAKNTLSNIPLNIRAYDYDGNAVLDQKRNVTLNAGERKSFELVLPAAERAIYFIEAAAKHGGREYFTRTNAAILPPHQYIAPEKSNIGIAAFFNEPDRASIIKLMKRIGVRYYRQGDNVKSMKDGIVSFAHNNVSASKPYSPAGDKAKLEKMVATFEKRQNPVWEFGNEWNMNKTREEKISRAKVYVSWLKPIREELAKRSYNVQLVALGLAGADPFFLQCLSDAGAWPLIDGVALHPGRGNITPDDNGNGWFYYGSIRRTREKLKELGEKPLHLTEVYACTQPNNWWVDSYRQSAENTLLTFAIGAAEHAESVLFYQMHNGVWSDINGINHKDREYDYGLLMRDHSPKPSLLGFAAAAEHLDGAEFIRYFQIPGTKIRGMEFSTPRGGMAVLYDRTEGTRQSKNTKDFAHKDPWTDHWKVHKNHTFNSSQAEITAVDAIGRITKLPVTNGTVTLKLCGAPLIVYGLDLPDTHDSKRRHP